MADRLDTVRDQLRAFVAERDWEQFHDPKNLAMAVASEAGELVAEYRWISNAEADDWSKEQQNHDRVAMEAADVGIALILLCDRLSIDLVAAVEKKITINAQNYPAAVVRGTHSRPHAPQS